MAFRKRRLSPHTHNLVLAERKRSMYCQKAHDTEIGCFGGLCGLPASRRSNQYRIVLVGLIECRRWASLEKQTVRKEAKCHYYTSIQSRLGRMLVSRRFTHDSDDYHVKT